MTDDNTTPKGTPVSTPERLTENGVQIVRFDAAEMPDSYIQQLVSKSRQDHVMEHEGHEDVGDEQNPGRFYDIDSYKKWATKGRTVYLMIGNKGKDVGGVVWFGKRANEHVQDCDTTFAIRIYAQDSAHGWEQYQGKGYGAPYMQATHQDYMEQNPSATIWLDVVDENKGAIHVYKKAGYIEDSVVQDPEYPERKRVIMTYDSGAR